MGILWIPEMALKVNSEFKVAGGEGEVLATFWAYSDV